MPKLVASLSVIAALTTVLVTPTYAQTSSQVGPGGHPTGTSLTPLWDTSVGYQVLHVPEQTFPFGLNVDGARNFGPWALAAEAGWAFDKSDDVSYHVFNLGAGPRWTGRSTASIWPFAQVLAGFVHARASTEVSGLDFSDSRTKFMLQPGAGAVVVAGDGWGIVGQVDYRRVFLDKDEDGESGENDFRVFVGVRFILD
jgi:hypothetical protein